MFDKTVAELYDAVVAAGYHPQARYLEALRAIIPRGSTVLELGCGTGNNLHPLNDAGIHCEGVDASSAMLERLHAKNPNATTYQSDVRTFTPPKIYDYALSCSGPFSIKGTELESYITDAEDALQTLRTITAHTRNGILINHGTAKDGLTLALPGHLIFEHYEARCEDHMLMIHALYREETRLGITWATYLGTKQDTKRRYPLHTLEPHFTITDLGVFVLLAQQ